MTDIHDWLSPVYVDQWVDDWTARPERAGQLRQVAAAIPAGRDEPIRVLDVGGGWGPLTQQVLDYRPACQVTLVDFSPRMLAHARANLAPYGNRARVEASDLNDRGWAQNLGDPFDAVVSSLAIHNLVDPDLIVAVYQDIHTLLRPGGCLLNLEIVRPASAHLGQVGRRWSQAGGEDPDQIEPPDLGDPTLADGGPGRVRSVANQLAWLTTAGFAQADCLWLQAPLALLAAIT